ncbi:hypothetical protein BDV29DRAFT_192367 [Aspergillus leporis]|uniref:VOC domain-containing protein n=1 Tax=Aspergillus leporis TaxID=41062 RepID=A0A5N5WZD8_9EURO|nr:hypothetical protein BDV29DRAFT_192367 [Aspergillus leporis]
MTIPPAGTPVGFEIPARDVARGSTFYNAIFNWTFAPSILGFPADKLLTFMVPGGIFPIGGALRRVDEIPTTQGALKLYLYVEDIVAALEHGGKKVSDVIPKGDKGLFQYVEDSEGNSFAIYTYK